MTAPVNPHCVRRWPFNDAEPGPLGHSIARAEEALCGATVIAELLHADAEIRLATEWADDPSEEPPQFTANVTAGLFAALHTCLHVAGLEVQGMPKRVTSQVAAVAAVARAVQAPAAAVDPIACMLEGEPPAPASAQHAKGRRAKP